MDCQRCQLLLIFAGCPFIIAKRITLGIQHFTGAGGEFSCMRECWVPGTYTYILHNLRTSFYLVPSRYLCSITDSGCPLKKIPTQKFTFTISDLQFQSLEFIARPLIFFAQLLVSIKVLYLMLPTTIPHYVTTTTSFNVLIFGST